jgi:CspA family cold shock protein
VTGVVLWRLSELAEVPTNTSASLVFDSVAPLFDTSTGEGGQTASGQRTHSMGAVTTWDVRRWIDACRGIFNLGRVIPVSAVHLFVMANGKVDFFNDTGGYGFISTDDDSVDDDEDVFFHMEDVGGPDLEEGQEVEFDIESSPKGPRATNLVRN